MWRWHGDPCCGAGPADWAEAQAEADRWWGTTPLPHEPAPALTPSEAATVARFDAAEDAL